MAEPNVLRRVAAGVAAFAGMVAVWPPLSAWWTSALARRAAVLSGGGALVPTTASPTLPIVAGVIFTLPLPVRTRAAYAAGAFASALLAEAMLVLGGAYLHASAGVLDLGSGIVQDAVPALWMLAGLARARAVARVRRGRR